MRHQLSLEVPLVTNEKILRIIDTSRFSDAIPVDCLKLEITVPGYLNPSVIPVNKGFILNLTTCNLDLQNKGCLEETYPLPDGIYAIRYSVSPNEKVYVEYNHLRATKVYNDYYKKIASFDINTGCETNQYPKKVVHHFQLIWSMLEAAKGKIEYRHEPLKGMELYKEARRLLEKTKIY